MPSLFLTPSSTCVLLEKYQLILDQVSSAKYTPSSGSAGSYLEGAGAPHEGHELLLLGVFHPCEETVLGNAAAECLEEVGEPDFTQVAHDLLERQPRHAGEELVGLLDAEHVVGVVQHERGGVVAVYVDARNVHAAGEREQVLQEHRVDGNHAVDLLTGTCLVQALGKVCDAREIGVEVGVSDAGRHAVGEQGVLLSGDITVHVGLSGKVGVAGNELTERKSCHSQRREVRGLVLPVARSSAFCCAMRRYVRVPPSPSI